MSLLPAQLNGTYFSNAHGRFIPVGAHWVPAEAALDWPVRWDEASIEADFAKMQDLGFNTVRFDLFWAWFEPRPGNYNPEAFKQLDFFIQMAHKYQIYLHPAMFIGGEVGEAYWDVPWRHGRHPHADPEMLRLQTEHASELARRYQGEPAILAWDLTDEPPFWIVSDQTTDAMAINWTRLVAGAIRKADPGKPLVVGISMDDVSHGPFRPDLIKDEVDFFSAHPYSIYAPGLFPDPMLSTRGTYCGAFQTLIGWGAGHPVMIHELGASSAQYTPERVAAFDRTTMYSSLAAGSNGFLLWCYTDASPETYQRTPYLRAPHETQFGLTTWDRQDRPQGIELRKFSQRLAHMDFSDLEPEPAAAGIIVPHEWAKPHGDFSKLGITGTSPIPYVSTQDGGSVSGSKEHDHGDVNNWLVGAWLSAFIMGREAGMKVGFPREYTEWQSYPLILLPAPLTSTSDNLVHVHTGFWELARKYVEQGGCLYVSVCADVAIPDMDDLLGARLADHAPVKEVTLKVVSPVGGLKEGETFHYEIDGSNPRNWPATVELRGGQAPGKELPVGQAPGKELPVGQAPGKELPVGQAPGKELPVGQVIAVDQDGHPAIIANQFGKGKLLLCTYPIESYLAQAPAAFEHEQNSYRIYQALSQWAGVSSSFTTNLPKVEVASLQSAQRGYAVLTNHGPDTLDVLISRHQALKRIRQVTAEGFDEIKLDRQGWSMTLEGFNGAIIEWFC